MSSVQILDLMFASPDVWSGVTFGFYARQIGFPEVWLAEGQLKYQPPKEIEIPIGFGPPISYTIPSMFFSESTTLCSGFPAGTGPQGPILSIASPPEPFVIAIINTAPNYNLNIQASDIFRGLLGATTTTVNCMPFGMLVAEDPGLTPVPLNAIFANATDASGDNPPQTEFVFTITFNPPSGL